MKLQLSVLVLLFASTVHAQAQESAFVQNSDQNAFPVSQAASAAQESPGAVAMAEASQERIVGDTSSSGSGDALPAAEESQPPAPTPVAGQPAPVAAPVTEQSAPATIPVAAQPSPAPAAEKPGATAAEAPAITAASVLPPGFRLPPGVSLQDVQALLDALSSNRPPDPKVLQRISAPLLAAMKPSERPKAEALIQAATECFGDCTMGELVVKAQNAYQQKKVAALAGKDPDEIHVSSSASVGAVVAEKTGLSSQFATSVQVDKPYSVDARRHNAAVEFGLGSTAGAEVLPRGRASVETSAEIDQFFGQMFGKKKLGALDLAGLKARWLLGLSLDRDLTLERDWRALGRAGIETSLEGRSFDARVTGFSELGAGKSGKGGILPFAQLGFEAAGAFCPFISKDARDKFCVSGRMRPTVGAWQAGVETEVGVKYVHKPDTSSGIRAFEAGVIGTSTMLADPHGVHSGAIVGGGVKIITN